MGALGYAWDELRRRWGRTVVTALGLAAGVGLIVGIVGVSNGLRDAQREVLSPLSSVGTDILVTRTVGASPASTSAAGSSTASAAPSTGAGGGQGFFAGPGADGGGRSGGSAVAALSQLNDADTKALLEENSSVVTDLSSLGKPGTRFTHDFFVPGTLISFPQQAVATVAGIHSVTSAVGGLTLQAQHETGTVPQIVAQFTTGGQTITSTVRPGPLTDAERAQVAVCLQKQGVGFGGGGTRPSTPPTGGDQRGPGALGGAFEKCMPKRIQEYQAQVLVPLRTIQQIVNPPKTDTTSMSYTAAGVDPAHPDSGLITKAQLTSGTWFGTDPSHQVLINTAYATKKGLKVGSTIAVNGTTYTVVGLVSPTLTGNVSDVYFDLATLQTLSSKSGRVNEVLVKVDSSADVAAVSAQIQKALPGAQVVTAASLADTVSGSLSDAKNLADRLGTALALLILAGAFVIAVLLTLSSVGKRVREIGTLRAVGWSRRRVVGQITLETLGIGLVGGVLGLLVGLAVCGAVAAFGPTLTATSAGVGVGASSLSQLFGQSTGAVTRSVALTAPIQPSTVLLGIAVALLGGLVAGAAGGWRAARLSPSAALRDLG